MADICQRADAGKKLRYVTRLWPVGVRQELPRSTYWLTMNLPLYSPTAPSGLLHADAPYNEEALYMLTRFLSCALGLGFAATALAQSYGSEEHAFR